MPLLFSGRKKSIMTQSDITMNDMENCYKPHVPRVELRKIGAEPPHPSIRAHLGEEFRLENCTTCCKKPNKPVCRFIEANKTDSKKFTGLDAYDRDNLWQFLGDAKYHLRMIDHQDECLSGEMSSLSVKCQFLLTLMILRRNYDYSEAGQLFGGVSARIVSSVFKTWIIFMWRKFR